MQQSLSLMQQSMLVIQDVLQAQPNSQCSIPSPNHGDILTKRESPQPKSNATLSQEGLSPPELDTDLQYKEAHPNNPSATKLTDPVPLNTVVTALAHLPVRLWMTQNPTESSVS
jgi:hypothetical protein